ncbi:MAG TPA: hypothetical protein VN345_16100 [Blastocatellia bacterium]|nr:hypothetical protein [Blastocatellia bacterium]
MTEERDHGCYRYEQAAARGCGWWYGCSGATAPDRSRLRAAMPPFREKHAGSARYQVMNLAAVRADC